MRLAARPRFFMLTGLGLMLVLSSVAARPRSILLPPRSSPKAQPLITAAPPAQTERPVPFKVGETLEYDVSWSSILVAGTATLKVQNKRASYGSTAYYIYAEGRPTPLVARLYSVYYKADALLDVYTLLPQRAAQYSDENGQQRMKVTLFDQARRTADYEVRTATLVKKRLTLSQGTHDLVSLLFLIRASPLLEGGRITVPVTDSGELYTVRMMIGARAPIRTPAGTFNAWRLVPLATDSEGQQVDNNIVIWMSDDARRLPVKLEAELPVGQFVLVLRSATL
jgi:hypothetical protein